MILSAAATGEIPGFSQVGKQRTGSFQSMLVIQPRRLGSSRPGTTKIVEPGEEINAPKNNL
jgi:hypothetical protein